MTNARRPLLTVVAMIVLALASATSVSCHQALGFEDPGGNDSGAELPGPCDDGTNAECRMAPPDCENGLVLAVQNSCYMCVDPGTCAPPAFTGERCGDDSECPWTHYCDPCGASSCPTCTDCVPACRPRSANLHLYVSNQSFDIDPVHIRVRIDGHVYVDAAFEVQGQHNWILHDILLQPGTHTIVVDSAETAATYQGQLTIVDEHWAVIDFWFYPDTHYDPEDEQFTFHISDDPIGFD